MKLLHNGQALIITDEPINARVLDIYPNLKVIGCSMTGLDHVDLEECKERGIEVLSLKYQDSRSREVADLLEDVSSTAEHTIGLIIALARNYRAALSGPYAHRDEYMGHSLKGKKILLVGGLGRVGRQVHRIAEAMGMDVFILDASVSRFEIFKLRRTRLGRLKFEIEGFLGTMLKEMDFVSMHLPLPGNKGFFRRDMFWWMKKTAYFINTARSGVVEDGALLEALQQGRIAGAAVDFIDDEGLLHYSELNPNVVLTNHIGGVTHEDRKKTSDFIEKKVDLYIQQLNSVSFDT